ncbi:MAG: GNAT family N-acetyltransferase [Tateyamaria sp.]
MTPEALAALHRAAFDRERPWTAEEFRELVANPFTHLETAAHGFALWRGIAGEAELLTIAVDPAHHRQGIGAGLMRGWLGRAQENCTRAFLEVASDNTAAIALYSRYGFEIAAKRDGYYRRDDGFADALIMQATLPFRAGAGTVGPLDFEG